MAEKQTNKDRMREIVDSIENGIKELFESDKYRKYLATTHLRLMRGFFLPHIYCACTGFLIPGSVLPSVSLQFCSLRVQESQPAVHRLRISASP